MLYILSTLISIRGVLLSITVYYCLSLEGFGIRPSFKKAITKKEKNAEGKIAPLIKLAYGSRQLTIAVKTCSYSQSDTVETGRQSLKNTRPHVRTYVRTYE